MLILRYIPLETNKYLHEVWFWVPVSYRKWPFYGRLWRHIIAVEPLDFRRNLAASGAFGATLAVKPSEAMEVVKSVAPKGADVVLEMVGHNQDEPSRSEKNMQSKGAPFLKVELLT